MPAPNVGDLGAALQFGNHSLERGQPGGHQVGAVAGTEETLGAGKHAGVMISPCECTIAAHRLDHLIFVEKHARKDRGAPRDVHRGILIGKGHGLLRGQPEAAVGILHVSRSSLRV